MLLACWNYTREEWQFFQQWQKRRKGILHYVLHRVTSRKKRKTPEIRIMADRVWINNAHEPFQNSRRQFRESSIHETGKLNILEICYESDNRICGINIPIPKGKLKEALEIQERLIPGGVSVG